MKNARITLTKLEASDGMMLTNGDSYGKTVYLGKGDKTSNWHEITEAEYDAIMQEAKNNEAGGIEEV